MIAPRIRKLLEDSQIDYDLIEHFPTLSSSESARAGRVPAEKLAKAVLVEMADDYLLVVLPADRRIELSDLRAELGQTPHLAREEDLPDLFDDCTAGAVPPTGFGYGIATIVDSSLDQEPDLYFEAGDHVFLVHVSQAGFARLMREARHGQFSEPWPDRP